MNEPHFVFRYWLLVIRFILRLNRRIFQYRIIEFAIRLRAKMEDLKEQILEAMSRNAPFDELYDLVKTFKLSGGSQEKAYRILEAIRPLCDEAFEDRILDLMDIVVGWCNPSVKIWETYLKT